jgi:hypothetical protein
MPLRRIPDRGRRTGHRGALPLPGVCAVPVGRRPGRPRTFAGHERDENHGVCTFRVIGTAGSVVLCTFPGHESGGPPPDGGGAAAVTFGVVSELHRRLDGEPTAEANVFGFGTSPIRGNHTRCWWHHARAGPGPPLRGWCDSCWSPPGSGKDRGYLHPRSGSAWSAVCALTRRHGCVRMNSAGAIIMASTGDHCGPARPPSPSARSVSKPSAKRT